VAPFKAFQQVEIETSSDAPAAHKQYVEVLKNPESALPGRATPDKSIYLYFKKNLVLLESAMRHLIW
jgi:hypothetical protein